MGIVPGPGEPAAGPWRAEDVNAVVHQLRRATEEPHDRPLIVALDGRGGAGKTTLARRLRNAVPASAIVHTDDLAWHLSFFGWDAMLHEILTLLHRGQAVDCKPPAWRRLGRAGSIVIPHGLEIVWIEGTGASRRNLSHLIDASIWVQSDKAEAERRLLARDGAAEESLRQEWEREEVPFLLEDQPWHRANLIVAGTPVAGLAHENSIVVSSAPTPVRRS